MSRQGGTSTYELWLRPWHIKSWAGVTGDPPVETITDDLGGEPMPTWSDIAGALRGIPEDITAQMLTRLDDIVAMRGYSGHGLVGAPLTGADNLPYLIAAFAFDWTARVVPRQPYPGDSAGWQAVLDATWPDTVRTIRRRHPDWRWQPSDPQ